MKSFKIKCLLQNYITNSRMAGKKVMKERDKYVTLIIMRQEYKEN